ncbi:MAG: protein translocase subunit SecF [Dongiaceae bacterium]
MFKPLHIVPAGTRIDFMRFHKLAFALSIVLVLGSIALFFTRGMNYGIDFEGGILMEVRGQQAVDLSQMRSQLSTLGLGEVALQQFGDPNDVLIRVPLQQLGDEKAQQAAVQKIKDSLGTNWEFRRTETVGPKFGEELKSGTAWAFALAMLGIMAYVWFRYEWQFGVNALIALFHDVVTTIGLVSLLHIEFNLTVVAAVLTVAGYSVNDKVVVYDRIRHELRRYKKMPLGELINLSLNATLSRTTVTSGLTLLSVLALALFGGEVLRGFSIALIWGIVIGTYSTIFVATPLLLYKNLRSTMGGEVQKEAAAPIPPQKNPPSAGVAKKG